MSRRPKSDLQSGQATVTSDPARHSVDDLSAAVVAAGYEASPLTAPPQTEPTRRTRP